MATPTRKRKSVKRGPFSPAFSPRVRFNWGYHDAGGDAKRGTCRALSMLGQQTVTQVSAEYDVAYYYGYQEGLRDFAKLGRALDSSEPAWVHCMEQVPGFSALVND